MPDAADLRLLSEAKRRLAAELGRRRTSRGGVEDGNEGETPQLGRCALPRAGLQCPNDRGVAGYMVPRAPEKLTARSVD